MVVLHLLGNHGPAYFRRYPDEFRRFTPTCDSAELSACSDAEIVNAYDNAILYTDHVLAAMVAYLQGLPDRDTALIYVSDHGESLGENGIYLHGLPYAHRTRRAARGADADVAVRWPAGKYRAWTRPA